MKVRNGASTLAAVLAVAGLGVAGVAGYRLSTGRCMLTGECTTPVATTTVSEKSGCCPMGGEAAATQTVALEAGECTGAKSHCEGMTGCSEEKTHAESGPACHGAEAGTTVLAGESTEAKKEGCCSGGDPENCDPSGCTNDPCCKEGEVASGGEKPKESSGG